MMRVIAGLSVFALAACGIIPDPVGFSTSGVFAPLPGDGAIKTANQGDVLLRQTVSPKVVAKLGGNHQFRAANSSPDQIYAFTDGMLLYGGIDQKTGGIAYCTFDGAFSSHGSLGATSGRGCLFDDDDDKAFDRVGLLVSGIGSPSMAFNAGPVVAVQPVPDNELGKMTYTPVDAASAPTIEIAIRYEGFPVTGHRLVVFPVAPKSQGDWTFPKMTANISDLKDMPRTVDLGGAKIEALKIEGASLTYRIINGFPDGGTMPLAYVAVGERY